MTGPPGAPALPLVPMAPCREPGSATAHLMEALSATEAGKRQQTASWRNALVSYKVHPRSKLCSLFNRIRINGVLSIVNGTWHPWSSWASLLIAARPVVEASSRDKESVRGLSLEESLAPVTPESRSAAMRRDALVSVCSTIDFAIVSQIQKQTGNSSSNNNWLWFF